jgi:histidinol-phosphatase
VTQPLADPNISSESARDLVIAHQLADLADQITMENFLRADLMVETKPDLTPVTEVDRGVERLLREHLSVISPDDAIVGEEYGQAGASLRSWVIDPIDGTKNFVRGVPVWATLIALMQGDESIVGVVSAPALGRRWWAVKNSGAFTGSPEHSGLIGRRIHVSKVSKLTDASISFSDLSIGSDHPFVTGFTKLTNSVWRVRGYGDFWQHCLVAEGAVDIAAEPAVALWDLAPLAVIVTEAGGRFTGLNGVSGPAQGSAVATNNLLHETALEILNGR